MITVERTDFVSVPVTDMQRSIAFYGETLEPEKAWRRSLVIVEWREQLQERTRRDVQRQPRLVDPERPLLRQGSQAHDRREEDEDCRHSTGRYHHTTGSNSSGRSSLDQKLASCSGGRSAPR